MANITKSLKSRYLKPLSRNVSSMITDDLDVAVSTPSFHSRGEDIPTQPSKVMRYGKALARATAKLGKSVAAVAAEKATGSDLKRELQKKPLIKHVDTTGAVSYE